jgi:hypothetical protein
MHNVRRARTSERKRGNIDPQKIHQRDYSAEMVTRGWFDLRSPSDFHDCSRSSDPNLISLTSLLRLHQKKCRKRRDSRGALAIEWSGNVPFTSRPFALPYRVRDVSNNACNTGENRRLRAYRKGGREYSPDVNSLNRHGAIGVVPRAVLRYKKRRKKTTTQRRLKGCLALTFEKPVNVPSLPLIAPRY